MTCPSSEALVAAAAPGASREARERVADHLVTCTPCAEEFRLLQELGPWAADHAHLLGKTARGAGPPTTRAWPFRSAWAYAAAAVIVLAIAALEVQVLRLQRDNRELAARAQAAAAQSAPPASAQPALEARVAEQQRTIAELQQKLESTTAPDLNAPIIDLEPTDAARSASPAPRPAVPAGARSVVFVLNTTRPAAGAAYDVELVGRADQLLWTGSGLKQTADRTLTLVVPRTLLTDATRLRLFAHGRTGAGRTLVEQYSIPAMP